MSLQDYATRKYDFLAFQKIDGRTDGAVGMALYSEDTSGRIITGIQKLAQRWALEFLTERGTMRFLPERGCDFMTSVRQGRFKTQADVLASFAEASLSITRNLRQEEYAEMPLDERFDDAVITSVTLLPGYVNLRVMITSLAGEERAVILPIETLP